MNFVHETLPQRVVFAPGEAAASAAEELRTLGAQRVMVIAGTRDEDLVQRVTAHIQMAARFDEVVMHVPMQIAQRAREVARDHNADAILSIGGGSATGLAKAVALTEAIPIVAIPTTYSGSEATNVWGLTEGETKTTGTHPHVLPASIVYDAELLRSLPQDLVVASGLNAIAHCVDAMWGPKADPIDRVLAEEGIAALAKGLRQIVDQPSESASHEVALYGAYLAAVAFASAGSGLHHKICHVLGGMFDLPHAQTHAVVLPHVVALNSPSAPEAEARLARAFGSSSGVEGLRRLSSELGAPTALRDLGMPEEGIDKALEPILALVPANNPTPVTRAALTGLLHAAWAGKES